MVVLNCPNKYISIRIYIKAQQKPVEVKLSVFKVACSYSGH